MNQSLIVLLLLPVLHLSSGMKHHVVYWNSTNPIFRRDSADNIVEVNTANLPGEYDQLNLICPNSREQHVIYSVSKEEFDACRVTNPQSKIVAECNKPERFLYFTITFRPFSPTPGGHEFKPGHTYYLISTSTARDIHRRAGGYCSTHNMKMVFDVAGVEPGYKIIGPATPQQRQFPESLETISRRPGLAVPHPRSSAFPAFSTESTTTAASTHRVYYPEGGNYRSGGGGGQVRSSDYLYYYTPRDLLQLKKAVWKHMKSSSSGSSSSSSMENETWKAEKLKSGQNASRGSLSVIGLGILLLVSHWCFGL